MNLSCTLYANTGFNSQNIPSDPAVLEQCNKLQAEPMNLFSNVGLNSIRVRVGDVNFGNRVDYIKVGGLFTYYYIVTGITWQAADVVEYAVTMDFLNSAGGVSGLSFVDGITERLTVASDSYGEWCCDDPLLAPYEPMKVELEWLFNGDETNTNQVVIEATLDPIKTSNGKTAKVYESGDESVSVPQAVSPVYTTEYEMSVDSDKIGLPSTGTTLYRLADVWDGSSSEMLEAVAGLRSLGLEQAIVNQVSLPTQFIKTEVLHPTTDPNLITKAFSVENTKQSSIKYKMWATKNNRINYSEYTKFGIMTCAGSSTEFDPADIYGDGSAPKLRVLADPHTDGKPYYRFRTVNRDSSIDGFWRNCVAGMQWKQVPLMYSGVSGGAIAQNKFTNNRITAIADAQFANKSNELAIQQNQQASTLGMIGTIPSVGMTAQGMANNPSIGTGVSLVNQGLSIAASQQQHMFTAQNLALQSERFITNFGNQTREALYDFGTSQVVVPTLNFPYNSETIRDIYNNGCLVYRYTYTENDLARIDKLLTMYGYKVTKALENSDFNTGKYFSYVKCSDITVTGGRNTDTPRWLNDGAGAQLRNGVRIWKSLPSEYIRQGGYAILGNRGGSSDTWNASTVYNKGDTCIYGGITWTSKTNSNVGITPSEGNYWTAS